MDVKTVTYTLPAYWASYLINGDASGISDQDQKDCDAFLEREKPGSACDCGESYFSWRNDSGNGLGGDVCEFTFIKH